MGYLDRGPDRAAYVDAPDHDIGARKLPKQCQVVPGGLVRTGEGHGLHAGGAG